MLLCHVFLSHRAAGGMAAHPCQGRAASALTCLLVSDQIIPDLAIVARMLANSASTKLANSSPAIHAGVQPFFSMASCQALCLKVLDRASISALRCSAVMRGAPYSPRQLPISTLMPCSLSVATFTHKAWQDAMEKNGWTP